MGNEAFKTGAKPDMQQRTVTYIYLTRLFRRAYVDTALICFLLLLFTQSNEPTTYSIMEVKRVLRSEAVLTHHLTTCDHLTGTSYTSRTLRSAYYLLLTTYHIDISLAFSFHNVDAH